MKPFHSGFVGIVGPTNSGKSTLLNALMGRKLSIVSGRVQTTYHSIRGIQTKDNVQFVFVDTPGFQRNRENVARLLNRVAQKNLKECDVLLWVFDASQAKVLQQIGQLKESIAHRSPSHSILLLNKTDKLPKPQLLPLIASIAELGLFSEIVPISALKKQGLERLPPLLESRLPEGQPWYSPDQFTDRSPDFVITEFIREKIYLATRQEVPYTVWVEMEKWNEEPGRVPTYRAVLHVDSESRRGILIGKQGAMLKRIGIAARQEIESYLGHPICLKLHVKVQADWREDSRHLQRYLELE